MEDEDRGGSPVLVTGCVNQPHQRTNRDVVAEVLSIGGIDHVDIAAAYVTTGGARDLLETMEHSLGAAWTTVQKRWLIAFDYCRTEPVAAAMLKDLPQSLVRVHDGAHVVEQQCMPTIPFHPKAFLFRGPGRDALFAGSGNISRSGLNTGHEVGLLLDCRPPAQGADAAIRAQIADVQAWYELRWDAASRLTTALANRYRAVFDNADNLRHPTPTDDDRAKPDTRPSTLSAEDLRKLRAANHFWIEAGNITKNLGKSKPGNQLMMKRLSRVFFGVPARDVPQNSPLTTLTISYDGVPKSDCSLTFSDNGMDKLTLPLPGAGGPAKYDGKNLLFTRLKAGVFRLELGTAAQKEQWVKKSKAIEAHHAMPPQGREWGIF